MNFHKLSFFLVSNLNEQIFTIYIIYFTVESHSSDLFSIYYGESPEMIESKERIFELVQVWLGISTVDPDETTPTYEETTNNSEETTEDTTNTPEEITSTLQELTY